MLTPIHGLCHDKGKDISSLDLPKHPQEGYKFKTVKAKS